jgi:O-succinylbenzoate synthase
MANQIGLLHVQVPMIEPFRISSGTVAVKDAIVVVVQCAGLTAFGEASPMAGSFYSPQTPETTWDFLAEWAVPEAIRDGRLRAAFVQDNFYHYPDQSFGWAGLEGALLDLEVQQHETSFSELLGIEPRPVYSGFSAGIYPSIKELLAACRHHHKVGGYRRIKIKIEPGWDVEPLRAVREWGGEVPLMADANGAYGDEHLEVFDQLDGLGLMMIEQPLASDYLEGHCRLQARLRTPICLDESADTIENMEYWIAREACRVVNVKIQRVGGILAARRMIERCARLEIPAWMGTMPELGIGALHAFYLAMHPGCVFPTDVAASDRWFVEDIVDPPIQVRDGIVALPEAHRRRPNVKVDAVDRHARRAKSFPF